MVWDLFRRRHHEDLPRLASAYRCFLKAVQQAESEDWVVESGEWRELKGGFGKAVYLLFNQWPTPNESRRFEKVMSRWLKKTKETDRVFIQAFNDYLNQKRLNADELTDVINRGREIFHR